MAKTLQKEHWLVHVLRRAGIPGADQLAMDPAMPSAEAWVQACEGTGLSQDTLARHVADHFRLDLADFEGGEPTVAKLVPEKIARQYSIFPLKESDRHLTVATSDPTNFAAEQALELISGRKAIFEIAPPPFVREALDGSYGADGGSESTGGEAVTLSEIGLPAWEFGRVRQMLSNRDGIVCVTGPAGSGKANTAYAALRELATGAANIATVEDPDVVLVGEIRDLETAEAAVQAARTGHLVLGTLNTDDAISVIGRLIEIGLDAESIATTLRGVLAQRLVRKICDECGEAIRGEMTDDEIRLAKLYNTRPPVRSVGCRRCAGTGYRGRLPIQEAMVMDATIADLITGGGTHTELYRAAVGSGMRPLQQVGIERVRAGDTTLEELERVLSAKGEDQGREDERVAAPAGAFDEAPPPGPDENAFGASARFGRGSILGPEERDLPILIVDDDPEDRLLVRTILQKNGFEVEEATTGSEALKRISGGEDYSLVLLDLELPTMGGREVLSRLRSSGATVGLPVIVLTGSPDPEDEYRVMEAGADDYLRKPLDPLRFIARTKAALRRARLG